MSQTFGNIWSGSAQNWSKMLQEDTKIELGTSWWRQNCIKRIPTRISDTPTDSRCPDGDPRCGQMSSKEAQDGSKEAEDSPEMSPGGLKMAPRRLKMDASWIQEASRGPHAGPKWNQKGAKCMPHGDPNGKYCIDKSVKILRGFT